MSAFVEYPPVALCETTSSGWRGLTEDGTVLNFNGGSVPNEFITIVDNNGETIGFRKVPKPRNSGEIEMYISHFDMAIVLFRAAKYQAALREIDLAIAAAPLVRAKMNRAFILMSLGRWIEGINDYIKCEMHPAFQRPLTQKALQAGLPLWRGEPIEGKRLLLIHDHGFGDSIMMLRFVPYLNRMGAKVTMVMPRELERLAAQCGKVVSDLQVADYFCPMLYLIDALHLEPHNIPITPYLTVSDGLIQKWNARLNDFATDELVGLAWSVGVPHKDDYPREIPLEKLTEFVKSRDRTLISVQQQKADEARRSGVKSFWFEDFADCAALMLLLDQVISVDTAALHLAGAIGHSNVDGLLSYCHSWRWLSPWYCKVTLHKQRNQDDWDSALYSVTTK
jgi:hypothetical protein